MFYVLEGNIRVGSGWLTRSQACDAVINILSRRRVKYGCNGANGGVDPCRRHDPRHVDACRVWRDYTVAINKARMVKDTDGDGGAVLVYGSAWHDSCLFVQHVRNSDPDGFTVPGIGAGDLAKLVEYGIVGDGYKQVRLCKIQSISDRRARIRITGQCFDGEKHQVWNVPIERLQAR